MSSRTAVLAVFAILVSILTVCSPSVTAATTGNRSVEIAAVYPNPVESEDAGEFVVVDASRRTALGEWSLGDGEGSGRLPNRTVDGRLVLSSTPNVTRNLTTDPVARLPDGLALANSGEELTLHDGSEQVDTLGYSDAPEGEVGVATADGLVWHHVGATDFPVVESTGGQVRAFVLPDGHRVPVQTLATADDRIVLAGYTLTANRTVDQLKAAARRGVEVRVLVDGSPVGGLTRREASALDRLVAANVSVTVLGGERARYEFHHAKYAVVDGRALVATENWKPVGTGGHGSRGWGVVVSNTRIVESLVETFRADAGWKDGSSWAEFRQGQSFEPADSPPANETYPQQFEPARLRAERIELLRAPDNAEQRLVGLIDNATESVRVEQVAIGGRHQPFLEAALRAADRGVRVRILLSGAWYVEEDNRRLVQWLNERAATENLPLTARIANPRGRFEKIHAKGVVVDGDQVLVGSLNWNNHSARQNREVALLLEGDAVGAYYTRVFRADWRGGQWRLTVGLAVAVLAGAVLALWVGRRIDFEGETAEIRDFSG